MSLQSVTFRERLLARAEAWWGPGRPLRERLHGFVESHRMRRRSDPDGAWRCCAHWRRSLINKWNSREFAARHGCRIPVLYWVGRRLGRLPVESLAEPYVVKPVWGSARCDVYVIVGGRDLLRDRPWPAATLREHLVASAGRIARYPFLVEGFVRPESRAYQMPVEYKCYMFRAHVAAIHVFERQPGAPVRESVYMPTWERFPHPITTTEEARGLDPPHCLPEILEYARRLGTAFGAFVRVDLYASDAGAVFGEFSAIPRGASGFTPYADRYFDALWREILPGET